MRQRCNGRGRLFAVHILTSAGQFDDFKPFQPTVLDFATSNGRGEFHGATRVVDAGQTAPAARGEREESGAVATAEIKDEAGEEVDGIKECNMNRETSELESEKTEKKNEAMEQKGKESQSNEE